MARKVLKYLNAYRRGIKLPSTHSKFDHEDFSSSSSSSDEDIAVEEKFANMRQTPPRTHLKRNRKKAETSTKISSSKKHDKFAKTNALHSRAKVNKNNVTEVIHPVLPLLLYDRIKEAVGIMDRPGWPNGGLDEHHLSCCEGRIGVAIRYFRHDLPAGWKYERDNARTLIAGYDRVFNDDRCAFII